MTSNADKLIASFPAGMALPDELIAWFRWLDEQGLYRNFDGEGFPHVLIDPAMEKSSVYLTMVDPEHIGYWLGNHDLAIAARVAPFCRTGGDGSYAAVWLDDQGATQFVHLGSGSGSTMTGIMADNTADFLRLLAIGYDELCWPEIHELTPRTLYDDRFEEIEADYGAEEARNDLGEFTEPAALRKWVATTFNATIPDTASEIMPDMANMDADTSNDPFWLWTDAVRN